MRKVVTDNGWVVVTWDDAADDEASTEISPAPADAGAITVQAVGTLTAVTLDLSNNGADWVVGDAVAAGALVLVDTPARYMRPSGIEDGDTVILTWPAAR